MVRLTPELIEESQQYMNPIREYELRLRGYKIGLIENLGATLNQFDTIDLTDNDIRTLDGFPILSKLKSLHLSNNKIQHVGSNLSSCLPSLETLILINNNIEELREIDALSSARTLRHLALLRNPVASLKHYRLYTIWRLPALRVLDFKRVRERERAEAARLYKGKKLKSKSDTATPTAATSKTFVPGEQLDKLSLNNSSSGSQQQQSTPKLQPTKEEMEYIRQLIGQAKSIEEIERLNQMLRSGQISQMIIMQQQQQQAAFSRVSAAHQQVQEEEDEDEMQN